MHHLHRFLAIATAAGSSQRLSGLTLGDRYVVRFALQNTADVPTSITVALGSIPLLDEINPPASGPFGADKID